MKKIAGVVSIVAIVALAWLYTLDSNEKKTETVKYADARLSILQLQKGVALKIKFMSENIAQKHVVPTESELHLLVQSIETIRAYGKDINNDAKKDLKNIVQLLKKSQYKNRALLHQLDALARTSQVVAA